MVLEAFILGTGGSVPLYYRYLSSMLLRREGELFLFDCGEATQMALRKINLKWKKISAIFITHMHADHITGLPGILMLSSQVERREPLLIFGPAPLKEYVNSTLKILDIHINYTIKVQEIEELNTAQKIYEKEDFQIRSFPLRHSKPCVGYTFEEFPRAGVFDPKACQLLGVPMGPLWGKLQKGKEVITPQGELVKPHQVMGPTRLGRKVSYVTDTAYSANIIKEVYKSDLLIMESMFLEKHREEAPKKKHMTARTTAKLAKEAQVSALGLIHYSPRYTKAEIKQLAQEAKEIFSNSFATYDGQNIAVLYPEEKKRHDN